MTERRGYRYYDFVMAAFVTVLLCSNFIGAAKQAVVDLPLLGPVPFGAGVLFFPISYIFGDILTEVYGYGRDRRVVWAGFGALAFASFMAWIVVSLPPGPSVEPRFARRRSTKCACRDRCSPEVIKTPMAVAPECQGHHPTRR